jgi:hypothetical protein
MTAAYLDEILTSNRSPIDLMIISIKAFYMISPVWIVFFAHSDGTSSLTIDAAIVEKEREKNFDVTRSDLLDKTRLLHGLLHYRKQVVCTRSIPAIQTYVSVKP